MSNFKDATFIAGVPEEIVSQLSEGWPDTKAGIAKALLEAGHERGRSLIEIADLIETLRPQQPASSEPETTQQLPPKIIITQEKEGPKEWMAQINAGDRDSELLTALTEATKGQPVFVIGEKSTLDVEASLQAIDHYNKHGRPPQRVGTKKCRTLGEVLAEVTYNNPLTGQPLDPGSPWYDISAENRLRAAYATAAGYLRNVDEWVILSELRQEPPTGRWEQWEEEFRRAKEDDTDQTMGTARRLYAGKAKWSGGEPTDFFSNDTLPGAGGGSVSNADNSSAGQSGLPANKQQRHRTLGTDTKGVMAKLRLLGYAITSKIVTYSDLDIQTQDTINHELKWLFAAATHFLEVRRNLVSPQEPVPVSMPDSAAVTNRANNLLLPACRDELSLRTFELEIKSITKRLDQYLKNLDTELDKVAYQGGSENSDLRLKNSIKAQRAAIVRLVKELADLMDQLYGVQLYNLSNLVNDL